jgi:hypothetical protein
MEFKMYILISNGEISQYPYSIGMLRNDNPQTSFPKAPTAETLAAFGVYPVQQTPPPTADHTKRVSEATPVLIDGTWRQAWTVTDLTEIEISAAIEAQWARVRRDRNRLLTDCDWTQLPDAPVDKQAWATYRQELRDITMQADPFNLVWPTKP